MERVLRSDATSGKKAQRAGEYTVLTDYSPELYAFRFPNAFINTVWRGRIPPRIGRQYEISTAGRCGGMAFASLDFFHLKTPVPTLNSDDFFPSTVPPDGHPLADYIYTRQLHSMLTKIGGLRDGLRYVRWSGSPTAALVTKSSVEEHKVIESIDRGQPVVLGLIKATNRSLRAQGRNHQVVCYGYRIGSSGRLELAIYDPNEPFQNASRNSTLTLQRADDRSAFPYEVHRPDRIDRWRGFFVARYRPRRPGPSVVALSKSDSP